ncbi:hypothetical protein MPH_00460 [Macrophomina phaseolina MS6]|uniref:Uncharacterized protein n=1 Tax=Macrophomina phaseolina (strain MS6) TaxID=1126212 RepID=K2S5G7_MACPH|nr:hypothetical protein MPH_00460 [Macrophomina phaseolina MS6]
MAHHVDEDRPHFERLINDGVSKLAPYAGLILTVSLVVIFLFRAYIFEAFLLERAYGSKYKDMEESVRRGFVNHHIAGTIKIFILIVAIYPMVAIAFGSSTLHSSFAGHGSVTKGDVLLCCSELVSSPIFRMIDEVTDAPCAALSSLACTFLSSTIGPRSRPSASCTIWAPYSSPRLPLPSALTSTTKPTPPLSSSCALYGVLSTLWPNSYHMSPSSCTAFTPRGTHSWLWCSALAASQWSPAQLPRLPS